MATAGGTKIASVAALFFAFAAFGLAREARAFPSSRLVYVRGTGAERCPEEGALRKAVATRLGYDPFFPSADRTIVVVVTGEPVELRAKLYLVDSNGLMRGLREFSGGADRCGDLVRALALSISIAIDPANADTSAEAKLSSDSAPAQAAARSPTVRLPILDRPDAPKAESPPAPRTPPASETRWSLGAGTVTSFGAAPVATLGADVHGSVSFGRASFTLEATGDLPSVVEERRYRFWSIGMNAVPCLSWGPWLSCFVARVGSITASGIDTGSPPPKTGFFAASGLRGGFEIPLSHELWFRVHADALATLVQVRVSSGSSELWSAPPIAGSMGADLTVHFR